MLEKIRKIFVGRYKAYFIGFYRIFGLRILKNYVALCEWIGLGWATLPGWKHVLKQQNLRDFGIQWAEERFRKFPARPDFLLDLVEAQIDGRKFDLARTTLNDHGGAFYRNPRTTSMQMKRAEALRGVLSVEEGGFEDKPATLLGTDGRISQHCYMRAWEMHSMLLPAKMAYFLNIYIEMENFNPLLVRHAAASLLRPNEMYKEIDYYVQRTVQVWKKETPKVYLEKIRDFIRVANVQQYLDLTKIETSLENKFEEDLDILQQILTEAQYTDKQIVPEIHAKPGERAAFWLNLTRYLNALERMHEKRYDEAIELLEKNIGTIRTATDVDADDQRKQIQQQYTLLAQIYERVRDFDAGLLALRRAVDLSRPTDWLDGPNWLLASALMHRGDWAEAGRLMRMQLSGFWEQFAPLSAVSIKSRIMKDQLVPPGNAIILGGRGIGDEILRLVLLAGVRRPGQRYAFTVDPRLVPLLQPQNDWVDFIAISRISGPFAVSEEQYWADREGVSARFDPNRVTTEIWSRAKRGEQVILSEDILVEALSRGPDFVPQATPLIAITPQEKATARAWLDSLPGKIKIGISWRSGELNLIRNLSYKAIRECGELLSIPDVDFINLQYTDTSAECAEVEALFGVRIHSMPGVDLKDDLREICALCVACDIVIAPCTTIREMAGAAGANVWSLTITPLTPDLWRIMPDKITDRYMPTIRHFTAMDHGDSDGVVRAMADEVRRMLAARAAV